MHSKSQKRRVQSARNLKVQLNFNNFPPEQKQNKNQPDDYQWARPTVGGLETMKRTTAVIISLLLAIAASAQNFTTISGKTYDDATVTLVEVDGITIKFKGGIVKLFFTELPADVCKSVPLQSTGRIGCVLRASDRSRAG